jgi:hypothetical protein
MTTLHFLDEKVHKAVKEVLVAYCNMSGYTSQEAVYMNLCAVPIMGHASGETNDVLSLRIFVEC